MRAVSDSIKGSWDEIVYINLLKHWYGLVEHAISRQSFVSSQWCKILAALRTKGWSDVLLMIRLSFIVPVSNAKLERMLSKLKRLKSIPVALCLTF